MKGGLELLKPMVSALDACTSIIFGDYLQSRLYLVFRSRKILQYRLRRYIVIAKALPLLFTKRQSSVTRPLFLPDNYAPPFAGQ